MKNNWFTIEKVHPRIFALAEFHHNEKVISYLVVGSKKAFLIDSGMGYSSIKTEVQKITNLPVEVLLTHSHWDHIGGTSLFQTVFVFDNPYEINNLKKGFNSQKIVDLNKTDLFANSFRPKQYLIKGQNSVEKLTDDQILSAGDFKIQVIHTPGHTPGSVCFWIPELKALFTGDTLYPGPIYLQFPESDFQSYRTSINMLKDKASAVKVIFPGHNEVLISGDLIKEVQNGIESISSKLLSPSLGGGVNTYNLVRCKLITKSNL